MGCGYSHGSFYRAPPPPAPSAYSTTSLFITSVATFLLLWFLKYMVGIQQDGMNAKRQDNEEKDGKPVPLAQKVKE